jgi:hypothetical protein
MVKQPPHRGASNGDGAEAVVYPADERVNLRVAGLFLLGLLLLRDPLHSPAGRIRGVKAAHLAVDGAKK